MRRAPLLLLTWALVAGPAAATERLKRGEVPTKGHYAVVIQDSGSLNLHADGAWRWSQGALFHVRRPLGVARAYRDAIVERLTSRGFVNVPVEAQVADAPRLTGSEVEIPAATAVRLDELALQHSLDLVLVLSEHTAVNQLFAGSAPLTGNGIYDRKLLGVRRTAAHSVYLLTVYRPRDGRALAQPGSGLRRIEDSWPEPVAGSTPDATLIERAVAEVEATVAESDLDAVLCAVGLLPGSTAATLANAYRDCRERFRKKR